MHQQRIDKGPRPFPYQTEQFADLPTLPERFRDQPDPRRTRLLQQ